MTPVEFAFLRDFLRARSGLDLGTDKGYLVESRLGPVARQAGLSSLSELMAVLASKRDPALETRVVEAMTTNESSFFRDRTPFDNFRNLMLPRLLESRATRRHIKVWCAAGSTGQEPYSLGIVIKEEATRLNGWRVDILSTDISSAVTARGARGGYSQFEVQRGMPIQLLMKYFKQTGDTWQVDDAVRRMVRWQVFNLLTPSYSALGRFDIVFCRNVLIYFDRATKVEVMARIADVLEPDGYLVLGAAETVVGLSDRFEPEPGAHGLYRKAGTNGGRQMLRAVGGL